MNGVNIINEFNIVNEFGTVNEARGLLNNIVKNALQCMGDNPVHVYRSVFPAMLNGLNCYGREGLATLLGSTGAALSGFSEAQSLMVALAAGMTAPLVASIIDKTSESWIEEMSDSPLRTFAKAVKPVGSGIIAASLCFGVATLVAVAVGAR